MGTQVLIRIVRMMMTTVTTSSKSLISCSGMFYAPFKMRQQPEEWILIDSQSVVDVFLNKKLLTNTCDAKQGLVLFCNAGKILCDKEG